MKTFKEVPFTVEGALDFYAAVSDADKIVRIDAGISAFAEAIQRGDPVRLLTVDATPSGGRHGVVAHYEPGTDSTTVEAPGDRSHFLTLLHALEVVAGTLALVSSSAMDGAPDIQFVQQGTLSAAAAVEAIFPMTIAAEPVTSVVLGSGARRVSPESLAAGYATLIRQPENGDLRTGVRHTMLVHARPESRYRPESNSEVVVAHFPTQVGRPDFQLANVGRISSWGNPSAKRVSLTKL